MMEGSACPRSKRRRAGVGRRDHGDPLPELLGAGGVYVDPSRPGDLHAALRLVLTSPDRQAEMRRAGLAAASRLTWTAAARDLVELMRLTVAS